jgi:hypothetical protein
MGMHHGYLVADLPWPTLFAILQQRTGRFADRGPIDSIDAMPAQSTDEGWWLAAGEYAGRAYVLDPSWLLASAEPDLIAGLAAESGALVIGAGAETVSGSYYLVAARGRQVLRHFYGCRASLAVPYSAGEPLPTEAGQPLDGDLNGDGLYAALGQFGFDPLAWQDGQYDDAHPGYRRLLLYTADNFLLGATTPSGPLAQAVADHERQYTLPPERRSQPRVVVSRRPPRSGVVDGPGGGGWRQRLGRWLGRG